MGIQQGIKLFKFKHIHLFYSNVWEQLWTVLFKPSLNGDVRASILYMNKTLENSGIHIGSRH
jgi:hypothetical protein